MSARMPLHQDIGMSIVSLLKYRNLCTKIPETCTFLMSVNKRHPIVLQNHMSVQGSWLIALISIILNQTMNGIIELLHAEKNVLVTRTSLLLTQTYSGLVAFNNT